MKRFFFFILIISTGVYGAQAQFGRTTRAELRLSILQKSIEPIYRKPSRKELNAIAPNSELAEKYAVFLRQPNTGLTKLINDRGCSENTKIIVVTESCLKYTMPGAGSSYSFRMKTYRIPRLADLTLTENSFQATGVLLHGILVNIGNIPLEKVALETKGIRYLAEFQPEIDFSRAKEIDRQLSIGIRKDEFLYRRGLFVVENTTFVLRSIAYGGKYFRAVSGITYNEFDFDKRKDVIVAFRIVEKEEHGDVVILWKQLQEKGSPDVKRSNSKNLKM